MIAEDIMKESGVDMPPSLVLICSIVPALISQAVFPLFQEKIPYTVRVIVLTMLSGGSFVIVYFSGGRLWLALTGIVVASFTSGVGEITYMAFSAYYHKFGLWFGLC